MEVAGEADGSVAERASLRAAERSIAITTLTSTAIGE